MNSYIVDCLEPQPGLSPAHCAQTPALTSMPRRVGAEPRYTFRPPGLVLRWVIVGTFWQRAGCCRGGGRGVLPGWLGVVSGMIRGCDRCAAGGAARGSA